MDVESQIADGLFGEMDVESDPDDLSANARRLLTELKGLQRDAAMRNAERVVPTDAQVEAIERRATGGTAHPDEAYRRGVEALMRNQHGQSAVAPKDERAKAEALKAGSRLADLVSHASVGGAVTPEMRSLAAGISSALGGKSTESRPGRAFAKDLVLGGLYVGKGWASGEFEWEFLGSIPGDNARISIRRNGGEPSVELMGDHGLAPYDEAQQGKFWHPTNWTEGTGVGHNTGKQISEAIANDCGSVVLPEDDEEF